MSVLRTGQFFFLQLQRLKICSRTKILRLHIVTTDLITFRLTVAFKVVAIPLASASIKLSNWNVQSKATARR